MPRVRFPALLLVALACGGDSKPADEADAAASSTAVKTIAVSVPEGTAIPISLSDPISSAADKMGATIVAVVSGDVRDAAGRIVVPPGSLVKLRIDEISGATSVQTRGAIRLSTISVQIQQQDVPLKATIDSVPSRLVDRMLLVERATTLSARLTAGLTVNAVSP
jgi:hypothetical protein